MITYVLVCGSRTVTDEVLVNRTLDVLLDVCENEVRVLHGAAKGADSLAGAWGAARGLMVKAMPAQWRPNGHYDRQAGLKRNAAMLDLLLAKREEGHTVVVVAFHEGRSPGTAHMVRLAREAEIPVVVERVPGQLPVAPVARKGISAPAVEAEVEGPHGATMFDAWTAWGFMPEAGEELAFYGQEG